MRALTMSEKRILKTLLKYRGCTTKVISETTGIPAGTINVHLRGIFLKLDVHSKSELIHRFVENPALLEEYGIADGMI